MKKLLILAGVVVLTSSMSVFAQDTPTVEGVGCPIQKMERPARKFDGPRRMHKKHFNFDKFAKDLDLTQDQIDKMKALREEQKAAAKPIFDQLKVKKQEFKAVLDEKLTKEETEQKLAPIKEDIKNLKAQLRQIGQDSKAKFDAILTKKQLKQLDQMKQQKMKRHHKCSCGCNCGCGCVKRPMQKFEKE